VSRSGGLSNELSNIISAQTDGVNEGMAIGGDRYPCTTFIDHLLRYQNEPTCKILVVLDEVGGTLEYKIIKFIKNGRITKPIIAWCTRAHWHNRIWKKRTQNGCFVPESFDDFGRILKIIYEKLLKNGVINGAKAKAIMSIEPPQSLWTIKRE